MTIRMAMRIFIIKPALSLFNRKICWELIYERIENLMDDRFVKKWAPPPEVFIGPML